MYVGAVEKTLTVHELNGLEKNDRAVSSSTLAGAASLGETDSVVEGQTEGLVRCKTLY